MTEPEPEIDDDSPHAARKFDLSSNEGLDVAPGPEAGREDAPMAPDEGEATP